MYFDKSNFEKFINKFVQITDVDGHEFRGVVTEVSDDYLMLDHERMILYQLIREVEEIVS